MDKGIEDVERILVAMKKYSVGRHAPGTRWTTFSPGADDAKAVGIESHNSYIPYYTIVVSIFFSIIPI